MSEDEFDNLSDPFASVSEAEWSRLLGQANSHSITLNHQSTNPRQAQNSALSQPSPSGSTESTDYGDDSFMDADTLAELDRIETSALRIPRRSSSSTHGTGPLSMRRVVKGP
jgi:hypothetical protein